MLLVVDQVPGPNYTLLADQPFAFTVKALVDPATVIITVGIIVVYSNETALHDYTVTRTVVVIDAQNYYHYVVAPPVAWAYGATLPINVSAVVVDSDNVQWSLVVEDDPTCFTGPINTFEQSLLFPYTDPTLRWAEALRAYLLDHAINRPVANRAVRWVLLRAHDSGLAPVLRQLVPIPTLSERQVRLCNQRSNLELDSDLRGKPYTLPRIIDELRVLGLPEAHAQLLLSYDQDDPNLRIPLACVVVCLAKAFDINAPV